jgi:surface antigen
MNRTAKALLLASTLAAFTGAAFADPPAHAPAHGWRKKNDPHYVGYTGKQWEQDFEISSGRCNRQEIATVIGGIAGGAIARRVAEPENRTVATIVGAIAGAIIGNRIGKELDEADRSCFGHALEIGQTGQRIAWTNETNGLRYELSPGADRPRATQACREYTMVTIAGRNDRTSHTGLACQSAPGVWQVAK